MFKNTRMLAEAGIMVGLALALWYFNVGQLPQGGSIFPADASTSRLCS